MRDADVGIRLRKRERISRPEAIALIARAREAVSDAASLQDLKDDYRTDTVFAALLETYQGVTNGFLSQVAEAITGKNVEVVGEVEPLLTCPCCHRRTLTERFNYDICGHCDWEDDGTEDAGIVSSVNGGTMDEYRAQLRDDPNYHLRDKWSR